MFAAAVNLIMKITASGWLSDVVSVVASHAVDHEFAPRLDQTKDPQKNGTNCLPAMQLVEIIVGVFTQCSPTL